MPLNLVPKSLTFILLLFLIPSLVLQSSDGRAIPALMVIQSSVLRPAEPISNFKAEAFSLRATAQQNGRLGGATPKVSRRLLSVKADRSGMIPALKHFIYDRFGGFTGYVLLPALIESVFLVAGPDELLNRVSGLSMGPSWAHWGRLLALQAIWHSAHLLGIDPDDRADALSGIKLSISAISLLAIGAAWHIFPTWGWGLSVVAPLVAAHAVMHLYMASEYWLMSGTVRRSLRTEAVRKGYTENQQVEEHVQAARRSLDGHRVGFRVWFDNGELLWFGLPDSRGNIRLVLDDETYVLQIASGRLLNVKGEAVSSERLRVEKRGRTKIRFTVDNESVVVNPNNLTQSHDERIEPMSFTIAGGDKYSLHVGLRVGNEKLRLTGDVPVYALAAREVFLSRFGQNRDGETVLTAASAYFEDLLAPDGGLVDLIGMGLGTALFKVIVNATRPDVIRLKNVVHPETVQAVLNAIALLSPEMVIPRKRKNLKRWILNQGQDAIQRAIDTILPETVVGKLVVRFGYRNIRLDWNDLLLGGILTFEARRTTAEILHANVLRSAA